MESAIGFSGEAPEDEPASASLPRSKEPESRLSSRNLRIALAEDNPGDVRLVQEALRYHGIDFELVMQRDGEEMLNYVDRVDSGQLPYPDLVLLDLNLPRHDGHAVLENIRERRAWNQIPVIIVTSSNTARDRDAALRLGANRFFCKPSDYDEFMALGTVVRDATARSQ